MSGYAQSIAWVAERSMELIAVVNGTDSCAQEPFQQSNLQWCLHRAILSDMHPGNDQLITLSQ